MGDRSIIVIAYRETWVSKMERLMLLCGCLLGTKASQTQQDGSAQNWMILEAAASKLILSLHSWPEDIPGFLLPLGSSEIYQAVNT